MLRHPVPESLLAPIGDVTVSFALLETTIQSLLGSLIREHQRVGQIVTSYLSFARLRAAVVSLYRDRHGADRDFTTLRELMRRAADIEVERNRITHSIWAAGHTSASITRIKITCPEKRGFTVQSDDYNHARLQQFADSIKVLAGEVMQYQIELVQRGKAINNPGHKQW